MLDEVHVRELTRLLTSDARAGRLNAKLLMGDELTSSERVKQLRERERLRALIGGTPR